MADALKLTELMKHIRENAYRWDQSKFAAQRMCGTTHCAAGFQAMKLGCTVEFRNGDWGVFRNEHGAVVEAYDVAAADLDLTGAEADALFYLSEKMKNLDDYESLVMAVADGKLRDWILGTSHPGFNYATFKEDWADMFDANA